MPIHGDGPKAPESRRLSNVAQALRRRQVEGTSPLAALAPLTGAEAKLDPARQEQLRARAEKLLGLVTPRALHSLDQLWAAGQFDKVLKSLDDRTKPLVDAEFQGLDKETLVELACQLFVLEGRVTALVGKLAGLPPAERSERALGLVRRVADAQTSLWRRAVALVQEGDSDSDSAGAWLLFREGRKASSENPGPMAPQARETRYLEKMRAFFQAGGDPSQIRIVDAAFLKSLADGAVVDLAIDDADVARAAVVDAYKPAADATLLAHGGDVLAQAQLVVTRGQSGQSGQSGQIAQVRVSSSHPEGLQHVLRHLVSAGVPLGKIVAGDGEVGTGHALQLLGDALGLSAGKGGAEAQRRAQQALADAFAWQPFRSDRAGTADGTSRLALSDALRKLRASVSDALADGAMLSTQAAAADAKGGAGTTEVVHVVKAIDDVLRLAEKGGNTLVYGQTMALLQHLAGLPATHIDAGARKQLAAVVDRWQGHKLGEGAFDPADVFSPPPLGKRRTRIVATINPKATDAQLQDMVKAGMDVARFNTAHGDNDVQIALMKRVRAAAAAVGRTVTIQVDLEGPKIRLGLFANPDKKEFNDIFLTAGDKVTLTTRDVLGDNKTLAVDFPTFATDVKVGEPVFMNDGNVELRVTSIDVAKGDVHAEVVQGGKVWDKKGINLPGSNLSVPTITDEDLDNLKDLLPHIDLIAPSFVRSEDDIKQLRREMQKLGKQVPVIAKIERPEGLDEIDDIAMEADALMVARGDLGVEIGWENVPQAERKITNAAKIYGKPVMVATEVFMSMVKDPSRPSRGDVEALYAAVSDRGADAVMLAKETSFPAHPAEVIRAVSRVIETAEEESAAP